MGLKPPADRLSRNLVRKPNGCLEWCGYRDKDGYGTIARILGHAQIRTHRLAWILKHGPIPKGMQVLHRCDNEPCCDEAHLFLGTASQNHADMVAKGRHPHGLTHGRLIIDKRKGRQMIRLRKRGWTQLALAKRFKCSQQLVSLVCRGQTWATR